MIEVSLFRVKTQLFGERIELLGLGGVDAGPGNVEAVGDSYRHLLLLFLKKMR